jgi:hypothetical protein
MVKSIDEIKDELLDNDYHLSPKTVKDLAWHLENDQDPHMAVVLATDAKLKELSPLITRHLDHEDSFVRERTVGCVLYRLGLDEYAEKGFEIARYDKDEGVRNAAVFGLGKIMNKVPFSLSQKMAQYLLNVFQQDESKSLKNSAYFSILDDQGVPYEKQPSAAKYLKDTDIDSAILDAFCKKYQVNMDKYTT